MLPTPQARTIYHLHGFLETSDFSDSEVGGSEQACFEIVLLKRLEVINVVTNSTETKQRRGPYIVWVVEIPNRNNVFVDHMQTCFNCVPSKIWTRHKCFPVSYNRPQRPGYPFGLDSLFSPTLEYNVLVEEVQREMTIDAHAIVNATLRERLTRCAIVAM